MLNEQRPDLGLKERETLRHPHRMVRRQLRAQNRERCEQEQMESEEWRAHAPGKPGSDENTPFNRGARSFLGISQRWLEGRRNERCRAGRLGRPKLEHGS